MTLAPKSSWAKFPRHFHPFQTEPFKVTSGELNLTVGKDHLILKPDSEKVVALLMNKVSNHLFQYFFLHYEALNLM
jgi:quercetin dioxygenase-like cupin family protein